MANHYNLNGETFTIKELAQIRGISPESMAYRLKKWGVEKAMETPFLGRGSSPEFKNKVHYRSYLTFNGETLPKKVWAERFGISVQLLTVRLNKGWPLEKALQGKFYGRKDRETD